MHRLNYTDEDVIQAIASSLSIRQVLYKLGLVPAGGNYASIHRRIKTLNLDTSHFHGKLWNKGKFTGVRRSIEEYLSNKFSITSHKLRLRLLKEGILPHQCNVCKRKTWLKKPIPLELEHKDGNHNNNNLSNLELLCPNCHVFTPTYRGKNKKNGKNYNAEGGS